MKCACSRGRQHPEPEHDYRTAYQRDRDRIIHSRAFRRLEYKTQVFVNHEGDHYRTRLTHTLEVTQIARTIARALRLNEDLAEAVALAHDIGHTPFGHSGEDALQKMMAGHGGFEHNRQGLRVVDLLELQYPDFRGLNLTYELRESIAKHTTPWDEPPVLDDFPPDPPVLEAQVVELADSIAYNNHDLDDGLASGILKEEELEGLQLWADASEAIRGRHPDADAQVRRRQTIRYLINEFCSELIEASGRRLKECGLASPDEVRTQKDKLIEFGEPMRRHKQELEEFLLGGLYRNPRVQHTMGSAKRLLEELFEAYVADPGRLATSYQEWAEQVGLHRSICDYIAGMTDRYAQDQYQQLFHRRWEF